MEPDVERDLRAAGAEYQAIRGSLASARDHLLPAVEAALRAGMKQSEVVRLSGYTREHVRRIARSIGINA